MRKHIALLAIASTSWSFAQNNIIGYEHWFDEDHTNREWTSLSAAQSVDLAANIPLSGLDYGVHYLRVRLKDSNHAWSSVLWRMFTIDPSGPCDLVSFRYWSDQTQNPPQDLTEVVLEDATQYTDLLTDLDFCTFNSTGTTRAFIQLKDSRSQWSSVLARDINIDVVGQGPQTVTVDGPSVVAANSQYTYTASSVGASWYEWEFPVGWTILQSTNNSVTVLTPNMITGDIIQVMANNSCGSSAEPGVLPINPAGLGPNPGEMALRVHPNPSTGVFHISTPVGHGSVTLMVHNSMGQEVRGVQVWDTDGRHTMDLGEAPNGLYTIRVLQDGRQTVGQVVLQR